MKKRLQFCISLLLILTLCLSAFMIPAASYENDVVTSSQLMLLMNMDTETPVFTKGASKTWYAGYLSEVMTFIITVQNVADPASEEITLKKEFLDGIENRDGSLDLFAGQTLTVKDLLSVMMLTSGSDAAYVLAHYVCGGDVERFVELMNRKASELGCTKTNFVIPGLDADNSELTTCSDLYKIYSYAMTFDIFNELAGLSEYVPDGLNKKKFTVTTNNSIMLSASPYYFRYVTGGKYSYDKKGGAAIVGTTVYRGHTYFFAALRGKNESEKNVFVDFKKLTTWAYLNLSDVKLSLNTDDEYTVTAVSAWGESELSLELSGTVFRTMPNEYDPADVVTVVDLPESVNLPVFAGQNIGTAKVYYKESSIDEISLVASNSEGVSLFSDLRSFLHAGLDKMLSGETQEESREETLE